MIENEASFESFRDTFLMPSNLSPMQRNSYVDKIKDSMGRNALSDSLVDIATNPFTYMMFLATPPAFKSLAKTGKVITGGAYNAFLKEKGGLLRMLGFTSASIETAGTPVIPIMQSMSEAMRKGDQQEIDLLEKSYAKVIGAIKKELGVDVKTLDPKKVSDPAVRQELQKIDDALTIRARGWDLIGAKQKDVIRTDITGKNKRLYQVGEYIDPRFVDAPGVKETLKARNFTEKELKKLDVLINERNEALDYYVRELGERGIDPDVNTFAARDLWLETKPERLKNLERVPDSLNDWVFPQPRELTSRVNKAGIRDFVVVESPVAFNVVDGPLPSTVGDTGFQGRDKFPRYIVNKIAGSEARTELPTVVERNFTRPDGLSFDARRVDDIFEKYNLGNYYQDTRKLLDLRRAKMFGDDSVYNRTGQFKPDRNKIYRYAATMAMGEEAQASRLFMDDMQSSGMMTSLVANDLINFVRKSPDQKEKLGQLLEEAIVKSTSDPYYFPDNIVRTLGADGEEIAQGLIRQRTGKYASGSEVIAAKTKGNIAYDADDIQRMSDNFEIRTSSGDDSLSQTFANKLRAKQNATLNDPSINEVTVRGLGFNEGMRRYADKTNRSIALHAEPLSVRTVSSLNESLGEDTVSKMTRSFAPLRRGFEKDSFMTLDQVVGGRGVGDTMPLGGLSNFDVLTASVGSLKGDKTQKFINDDVLPMVMGERTIEDTLYKSAVDSTRDTMKWLASGPIGDGIGKLGPWGKQFRDEILRFSEDDQAIGSLSSLSGTLAKGLYVSHLGLNMGSVTLNMLQPLTMGMPMLGASNTFGGWYDALGSMLKYAQARSKLGVRITDSQRQKLLQDSMTEEIVVDGVKRKVDFSELADLGLDPFEMVDVASLRHGFRKPPGAVGYGLLELGMKPFEKAEWFNRLAMAHATKRAYRKAGKLNTTEDLSRLKVDAADIVQRTQFGSDPLNRPRIFYKGLLTNPLARQFLQFPVRQVTGTIMNPLQIGDGSFKNVLATATKAMGYSAITYEVGKNLLGTDLSRGLYVGSITDPFGGQRFLTADDPAKELLGGVLPPSVGMIATAAKAIPTGDWEALGNVIPQFIPNGIAISKAIGVLPQLPFSLGMQRNFADWSNMRDGKVPYYKADGRFLGHFNASETILKGLGADMSKFKESSEISAFMLKNREQMRDSRRQWIASVLANDVAQAERIKAKFEKKYGMPMTVTKTQMKSAIKLRDESVVSRIAAGTEVASRDQFMATVPGNYFDKPPETMVEAQTAKYIWANLNPTANPAEMNKRELTHIYQEPQ